MKSAAYRESRIKRGKGVDWRFVRRCLRYRQEVRDLRNAGFEECRSWAKLPFEDQLGVKRIVEARIANQGKSLWVRISQKPV
jgi:hypothetical protein